MTLHKTLHALCQAYAQARIDAAQEVIQHAQEAANLEEKSSSGDKYETGRAMAHLEKEKAAAQLHEGQKLMAVLRNVPVSNTTQTAALGSVVITDKGNFYLSVSAGKLKADTQEYLALSPTSPLGACLLGCQPGDRVSFQKNVFLIEQVL